MELNIRGLIIPPLQIIEHMVDTLNNEWNNEFMEMNDLDPDSYPFLHPDYLYQIDGLPQISSLLSSQLSSFFFFSPGF